MKRLIRKKRINGVNIMDTYSRYKESVPKELRVNKVEYYKVIRTFLKYMSEKLIDIGLLKLPSDLGVLQIMGDNIKINIDKETGKVKGAVDWNETKKLWKECEECKKNKQLVFYTNDLTGFKVYKIFWFTTTNKLVNKSFYRFKACLPLRKKLAKHIKNGNFTYLYRHQKKKK